MRHRIVVTDDASRDLESICDYIAETGSPVQAERIVSRLLELAASLAEFPERGSHPRELAALGRLEFRQAALKPWLVIYGIRERDVVIYLIADGRRDMQALLAQRLLHARTSA